MHRSGTSAITGVLGHLGLSLPREEDQWVGRPDNPTHYESVSLTDFNDALLQELGGTWNAPPDLDVGWESVMADEAMYLSAKELVNEAFPGQDAAVLKDPRLCLLLPLWRKILGPVGAVVIWRNPYSVASSLLERNHLALPYGLALWERYTRLALRGLEGMNVLIVNYDALISDPASLCQDAADWLSSVGLVSPPGGWRMEEAQGVVKESLRHHRGNTSEPLFDTHRELANTLHGLEGRHMTFSAGHMGPESSWCSTVLSLGRVAEITWQEAKSSAEAVERLYLARDQLLADLANTQGAVAELEEESSQLAIQLADALATSSRLEADLMAERQALKEVKESRSWRITGPLRSTSEVFRWQRRTPL